jgi:uncharacterized protein HemX
MEMRSVSHSHPPMPPTHPPVTATRTKASPTAQPPAPATNVARTATNVRTGVLLCGIMVLALAVGVAGGNRVY